MAKIIYAVAGEGLGHSTRSHLVGQRLIDAGHNVMFVGSKNSLLYLKQYFGPPLADVKEIFGLSYAYGKGSVAPIRTVKKNLVKFPGGHKRNKELFKKHIEPFGPDLVISDFEPFGAWWAWRKSVPFISIDNEHVLTLCKLERPAKKRFSRLTAGVVVRCHYVGAAAYVIMSFFKAPLKIDSAVLAPPIVRPVVCAIRPPLLSSTRRRGGEHILVYSTTGTGEEQLREALGKFGGQKFYVYGFNKDAEYKNCIFKKRSIEGFLADLASARGVIASAGFSLISECMYLKKKMLLLPLAGQYEQIINAHYVQKLGLGLSAENIDEPSLARFLDEIDKPMPTDERIIWPDNDKFFQILQQVLNKLDNPVSIAIP